MFGLESGWVSQFTHSQGRLIMELFNSVFKIEEKGSAHKQNVAEIGRKKGKNRIIHDIYDNCLVHLYPRIYDPAERSIVTHFFVLMD